MLSVKFKIDGETEFKRVSIPRPATFQELVGHVCSNKSSVFKITYTDDEGDAVSLSDDLDLAEALRLAELTQQKVLRLVLKPKEVKEEKEVKAEKKEEIKEEQKAELTESLVDGKAVFALCPEDGVRVFVSQGLVEDDAQSIARFFHNSELSWKSKGEYMSNSKSKFAVDVMEHFVEMMNFKGCTLDAGLRKLSAEFLLPREGGPLDKIMTSFSKKYKKDNIESKLSVDSAYVIAYALMMLSWSLHDPNETPVPLNDFVSNLEGVNGGDNFPQEFLNALYENVKKEPVVAVQKSLLVEEKKIEVPKPTAPPIEVVEPQPIVVEKKKPEEKPKTAFEANLQHLEGMGFNDRKINIQVLVRNRNKLDEAIQELLKMKK